MQPYKAPTGHELVIPAYTALVVPVIDTEAIGRPLDEMHVHRPANVAALASANRDALVDEPLIATMRPTRTAVAGGHQRPPAGYC